MWYRIDFKNNLPRFIELEYPIDTESKKFIKPKRQIMSILGDEKGQVSFIDLAKDPLHSICMEEYIRVDEITSFGFVNEKSELWQKILSIALEESKIVTPDKKLVI